MMNELITLITVAKALGFDLSRIIEIVLIFFMVLVSLTFLFWRVGKSITDAMNRTTHSIQILTRTFQEHVVKNDERLTEGDRRFEILETRFSNLEARCVPLFKEGTT